MVRPELKYPMPEVSPEVIWLKQFITNPNIEVGDYTYYHDRNQPEDFEKNNVLMIYTCKLKIGKFCQLAEGTTFLMSDANHPMSGISTFPFAVFGGEWGTYEMDLKRKGDTVVGNDVWFGHKSFIMPGVTIGDGAIIASRSIVTKDVEPYTIVGGNPAKVIRKRFSEEEIAKLQKIQWWNWDHEKITQNVAAIAGADIEKLDHA